MRTAFDTFAWRSACLAYALAEHDCSQMPGRGGPRASNGEAHSVMLMIDASSVAAPWAQGDADRDPRPGRRGPDPLQEPEAAALTVFCRRAWGGQAPPRGCAGGSRALAQGPSSAVCLLCWESNGREGGPSMERVGGS